MKQSARRRRRIALVALLPVAAALAVWTMESGRWLVVYNDTSETLTDIGLAAGDEQWSVRELAPRESRRLRVRGSEATTLVVDVPDWTQERNIASAFSGARSAVTTVRLEAFHTLTITGEPSLWDRCLNW